MTIENPGAAPVDQTSQAVEEVALDNVELEGAEGGEVEAAVENAEAVLTDPTATKAEKVEAKKRLKSLKLKVDGKEYNEELPFEIDDDPKQIEWMTKQLQLAKVSSKRMQEKSEIENEIREFIELLREDPEAALSNPHIGVDLKKFATKIIEKELEDEKKSPAELKAEKLERELKAIKESQEKEKTAAQKREQERIQKEAYEKYDMQMEQVFQQNADIPKSPYFVKRISDYVSLGLANGMDVTPQDVIGLVREEAYNDLKQLIAASPDNTAEELFGKERLAKMSKSRVAKAKAAAAPAPKVVDTGTKTSKDDEKKPTKTIRDMFGV